MRNTAMQCKILSSTSLAANSFDTTTLILLWAPRDEFIDERPGNPAEIE
jgi:hypothetical protein